MCRAIPLSARGESRSGDVTPLSQGRADAAKWARLAWLDTGTPSSCCARPLSSRRGSPGLQIAAPRMAWRNGYIEIRAWTLIQPYRDSEYGKYRATLVQAEPPLPPAKAVEKPSPASGTYPAGSERGRSSGVEHDLPSRGSRFESLRPLQFLKALI